MDESAINYTEEIKKHYVREVINSMIAEAVELKFTRPYALLSLIDLSRQDNNNTFHSLEEVFNGVDQGYNGTKAGISFGLDHLKKAGLIESSESGYRLTPVFSEHLLKERTELKKKLSNFNSRNPK